MLKLRHILAGHSSRSEVEGDRAFFLRNTGGDMLSLFTTTQTRYEGWYINREKGFTKILESIQALGTSGPLPVTAITNTGNSVFWEYADGTRLAWKLLANQPGLTVSASSPLRLRILLDIRHIYGFPSFGRNYEVISKKNGPLLRYTDPEIGNPVYLHIRCSDPFSMHDSWQPQHYGRDKARNSEPSELYVYDFGEITTNLIGLGFGSSQEEAERISLAASRQRPQAPAVAINHTHDNLFNEVGAAKSTVQQALKWLQSDKGMWAGLPWFHQVWSRDELIAAIGLPAEQQLAIIERYLELPLLEGELPTFLGSGTTCADGVGWLCLLVREYGLENLSEEITQKLSAFLTTARTGLKTHRQASHGLIFSGHNATWMDTIGREGYRLEIQCMYALLLEELYALTHVEEYEQERLRLLGQVRHELWGDGYLKDGLNDSTLRPNVFLAYLLQPDLLSAPAWQSCFDRALEGLFETWGGLSSIDKNHPDYHPLTTGENNLSYHNGDSWFFVNNLAGIAMLRLNQHYFGKKIVDILQSSTEEILWEHMIGQPGEISSASTLDSYGCGIQAFSGGTYLAFLREFEDYSAGHERASIEAFWDSTAVSS